MYDLQTQLLQLILFHPTMPLHMLLLLSVSVTVTRTVVLGGLATGIRSCCVLQQDALC